MRIALALWLLGASAASAAAPVAPAPAVAPAPVAANDPILGWWRGHAVFRGASVDLQIHFIAENGTLRASLSCPDMMILDQPLQNVVREGRRVRFGTPDSPPLQFHGLLEDHAIRLSGRAPAVAGVIPRAAGADSTVELVLTRATAPPPPPYEARGVRFANGAVQLAGTVFVPAGAPERRPGVVLLQGSSANRRTDYLFYADHFARAGFAVLAFDKRGAGESTGDYGDATYDDLANDAAAAVACLRAQAGVDSMRVGVWGLSQGGLIGPLVAARVPSLRFLVAVSAPGVPVGEGAAYQDSVRLAAAGFDAADIRRVTTMDRRMQEWLQTRKHGDELGALLREAASSPWRRASSLPPRLPAGAALEGWYWRGRTLDPTPIWNAVRVPALVLHGAADELMLAGRNSRLIERALKKGGNKDVTARVFPAANHMLKTLPLVAGGAWDWPRSAPGYLEQTTGWMRERSAPPARSADLER